MTKPTILQAAKLPAESEAVLMQLFNVLKLPANAAEAAAFLQQNGPAIRGMALRKTHVDAAMLDALPALEIISSYSAGLDNLDIAHARRRGIKIEATSHILVDDVANLVMGLALALTRGIPGADAYLRAGRWADGTPYPLGRSITGMKIGIVGFGTIGAAVAARLHVCGARIAYYGPSQKPVAFEYCSDIVELASRCDMLILTCPLSPQTHHLVDARVIAALGASGYLINVARGPVVDEPALIAALAQGELAGAALDVFEHEPHVPEDLIRNQNVILTPHIGSATEETRRRMAENVVQTLAWHFGLPYQEDAARTQTPAPEAA